MYPEINSIASRVFDHVVQRPLARRCVSRGLRSWPRPFVTAIETPCLDWRVERGQDLHVRKILAWLLAARTSRGLARRTNVCRTETNKSFRTARRLAVLDDSVVPHTAALCRLPASVAWCTGARRRACLASSNIVFPGHAKASATCFLSGHRDSNLDKWGRDRELDIDFKQDLFHVSGETKSADFPRVGA
jgi:hypothetical protein